MIEVKFLFPDQASLIAFLTGKTPPAAAADAVVKAPAPKPAPPAAAAKPEAAAPKADPKPAVTPPTTALDYPTLQKAVFALVSAVKEKGLDPAEHVLGIAKSFGFDNFAKMKDAGPAGAVHYADALAAVQAKHAEVAVA